MPKIRQWQTKTGTSTRSAQFSPVQTKVTGQKRAFLQRFQPQKTSGEVENDVRRERGYKDQLKNIWTNAAVQIGVGYTGYRIQAAREAYKAETDSIVDEAKSKYMNEAAKVSAEQKYNNVETVDENGNFAFASDIIEKNYNDATSQLADDLVANFAGRKDAGRARAEFEAWRNNVDMGHKQKLYTEGAAISYKHAQERYKMNAMNSQDLNQLDRVLTAASQKGLFSETALYELKMQATEKIHTNQMSLNIEKLDQNMASMTDEVFDINRDQLVSTLWNDNDDLIITGANRTLMLQKLQNMDQRRAGQVKAFEEKNYLSAMQDFARSGGDINVLKSAVLHPQASEVFGHENTLKMIRMVNDKSTGSADKQAWQNVMNQKIMQYKTGQLSGKDLESWAIANQKNIGNIGGVFNAMGSEFNSQQTADIKAARDQMSYHYTGMRADEQDFTGNIGREAKSNWAKAQADLSAWLAENPSGVDSNGMDVREWSMSRILNEPLDPEVMAIEGVGETLMETDWSALIEDRRSEIIRMEQQIDSLEVDQLGSDMARQLDREISVAREHFVTLQRYYRTYSEIKKPENASVLNKLLGDRNE